ncbi:MAG: diguanylate cyclase [Anaerolineae bacterium]|nr:diguanylate cyclase [Anaerolineae bacterium]
MELKRYVFIVKKRWWIVLVIVAATLVSTYFFSINQTLLYRTTTTFIMSPRLSSAFTDDGEVVKAVDILSNRVQILTTYAEVAKSKLVKDKAIERLDLNSAERKGLSVQSGVVAGTNVLEISVQGPNPTIVRDFANVVAVETRIYVSNLYDVFELEPLDEAVLATKPFNSTLILNMVVGGILGLILGIVIAFLTEYFLGDVSEPVTLDIIDYESGAYNEAYFRLRLRQEMSRAKRNSYSFSLALIYVSCPEMTNGTAPMNSIETLRRIATTIGTNLHDEDILARYGETTFALLLFDIAGQSAKQLLQELQIKLETATQKLIENINDLNLQVTAGIVAYEDYDIEIDELLAQAEYALKNTENTAVGAINLFSKENSNNFTYQNGHSRMQSPTTI